MEVPFIVGLLIFLGLMFGSFAGAQVWRLRARQLIEDKREGESVDQEEYDALSPLASSTVSSDRSQCLHCRKTLAWYDLLPLVSWVSTRGKCRYCKKSIGVFEPLMELGTAAVFTLSYVLWPLSFSGLGALVFALWLVAVVLLIILFAYDFKWFLLPDSIVFPLVGVGLVMSGIKIAGAPDGVAAAISVVGAIMILSGLYFLLWVISKGQWIGFGDIKLGLGLALLLGNWQLALLALFLANLIGSLIVLPGMMTGKLDRKAHIPFGPLLILGTVIAMLVGEKVIALYVGFTF